MPDKDLLLMISGIIGLFFSWVFEAVGEGVIFTILQYGAVIVPIVAGLYRIFIDSKNRKK